MNFTEASQSTSPIPNKLHDLGTKIQSTSDQQISRNDFCLWFESWLKEVKQTLESSSSSLLALEEQALLRTDSDIIQREAVKDAIELQQLVSSISSQIQELEQSIKMDLKTGHLWRCWACKIKPLHSKLELSLRKFKIAISGL